MSDKNRAFGSEEEENSKMENIKKSKSTTPYLDNFGKDYSKLASNGKLDPVIGRESEIDQTIQILNKRKKNNPILIGEPGVGKCFCSDTQVVMRNDITGEVVKISVEEFIKTLSNT